MKFNKGITLLESLFALSILLILLGLGTSFTTHFLDQHRLNNTETQINATVYLAKVLAFQHHQTVFICPTRNQINCSDDWSNSWMLFLKPHKILRVNHESSQGLNIVWHGLQPIPITKQNLQADASGHFDLSTASGLHRRLVLSRNGELRVDES